MQSAMSIHPQSRLDDSVAAHRNEPLTPIITPAVSLVLALVTATVLFIADIFVPRGATPAIGYALVPVLAGGSRKRSVMLTMTALCTVLTWVGFLLEPSGAPQWMSIFERLMISGVLWLSLLLVWRRFLLIEALAERTSELERASDDLSRSNEELDRFASRVAHDLRGPLNTISLAATLLSRICGAGPGAEGSEWNATIQREIDAMNQLIERLLAYGRVGRGALHRAACDCEAVMTAVTQSLAAILAGSSAAVTHDPLPLIQADPVLIAELIQNLIENAVKYRGDHPPQIHLSATRANGEIVFAVRDNGMGISEPDRTTIFRPFTQLKRVGESTGVGLGLATCKRIVQRHGGRIWVESTVGQGSTFFFAIPEAPAGVRTEQTPPRP